MLSTCIIKKIKHIISFIINTYTVIRSFINICPILVHMFFTEYSNLITFIGSINNTVIKSLIYYALHMCIVTNFGNHSRVIYTGSWHIHTLCSYCFITYSRVPTLFQIWNSRVFPGLFPVFKDIYMRSYVVPLCYNEL
jgi:hypothetical protein